MMELGIDDEEELETNHDATTKKVKPNLMEKKVKVVKQNLKSLVRKTGSDSETKKIICIQSPKRKASSKSQQRLFGMVHALNKGELKKSDVSDDLYQKIKKISDGMTKKDAKKMAKTNHDDLL